MKYTALAICAVLAIAVPVFGDIIQWKKASAVGVPSPSTSYVWSMAEAPGGVVCVGFYTNGPSENRVYKTNTGGDTWFATAEMPGIGSVTSLLQASDGYLYAGGRQASRVFRTNDGGASWTCVLNTSSDSVRALAEWNGMIYAGFWGLSIYRSLNGLDWTPSNLSGITTSLVGSSDGHLYAGLSSGDLLSGVYRSSDGMNWESAGLDINVSRMAESSGGAIYAGKAGTGKVFYTQDSGATWIETLLPSGIVCSLEEGKDGYIYAGTENQIFRTDGNSQWELVGSFNASYIYGLFQGSDGTFYAGVDSQIYTTTIPEPTTLCLLAVGAVAFLRRRR